MREGPFDHQKPDKPRIIEIALFAAIMVLLMVGSYYLWITFIRHACEV